jgi:hypothetical protein
MLIKTEVAAGDKYFTLVFLLNSVFAFYLAYIASENEQVLVYFSVGTLLGLIPSLMVLFLQAGGNSSLASIGLGVRPEDLPERAAVLVTIKLGGLWTHGNEAGHVYAVAAASALYLTIKYHRPMIYFAAYAALVASFAVTLNRAGLIVPTIAFAYCFIRLGDYFLYVKSALVTVVAVVVLVSSTNLLSGLDTFYDSFESRFLEDSHADANVSERLMSNAAGFQIALENPFGIGIDERISQMLQRASNGVISIHNGYLSLAYQSSIFVPLLYLLSGIYLVVQRRKVSTFYVVTFLFTAGSMLFEELSINQVFIFSVAQTIAAAWIQFYKSSPQTRLARSGINFALGKPGAVRFRAQQLSQDKVGRS